MATSPRWVDRGTNIVPLESVSAMTRMRLQEARQYAAEAEKEAEAAREHAAGLTVIADAAAAQRDYWERVAEIADQVDLRLATEDGADVEEGGGAVAPPVVDKNDGVPF